MELRRLSHLVALADECHFARAAERVHLSQPAFSRSIQAIEGEMGMRLFDRETGEVRATPAGKFVIERARRLLFDARNLQRDVDLYRDSRLGDTAFGVGPFPAATLMPRVLPELRRLHPRVAIRVEASNWALLLVRLQAEDIEFFVADMRELPATPALEIRPLGRQSAGMYARAGHPLAKGRCTLSQAWRYGVATTKVPVAVKVLLAKILGLPADQEADFSLECDDFAALKTVALTTDTILAATVAAVRADVESGALVALLIKDLPVVYAEMGVVCLRDRTPSPMARRAIECIERVAAEINV